MTLSNLIALLHDLDRQGFGQRRVVDDKGNDVAEVAPPLRRFDGDGYSPDADAVQLSCYIKGSAS